MVGVHVREEDVGEVRDLLPGAHLGRQGGTRVGWLSLDDGDNDLAAYLVEGPVGDEVLRPLTVREAD